MREFIILDVPSTFPCLMAALSSLPAAQEKKMEIIRVQKPGHTCDFMVPALEKLVARARYHMGEIQPPKTIMGGVKKHESWGNVIEPRIPVWPGLTVQPSTRTGSEESKTPPSRAEETSNAS